jgi:hypothetical protein
MFFIQQRAGRNGRPFGLIKFRTMHPCDEPRSEWVSDNVDRITRVGHYLRRFRFDELPQLVNVLRGDMNLVGPRPHPVTNQAVFMEKIAYYGLRSTVRPGVTGWAQIRYGYANNLAEETEKMRYDLYYIKNRSLWLDLRIMLETVLIVLFGTGASEVAAPPCTASSIGCRGNRHARYWRRPARTVCRETRSPLVGGNRMSWTPVAQTFKVCARTIKVRATGSQARPREAGPRFMRWLRSPSSCCSLHRPGSRY